MTVRFDYPIAYSGLQSKFKVPFRYDKKSETMVIGLERSVVIHYVSDYGNGKSDDKE